MDKHQPAWEKDGFRIRPATPADAEPYYLQNYCPLDPEVARLTGCPKEFSREQVVGFLGRCIQDPDRYDFLILSPDGRIIGETVLNEIDWRCRSANFRICLFRPQERGWGIGSWATQVTRDFAFGELGLHRLSLTVFSFNPRGEATYRKAGFRREGILRDAVLDGDRYGDEIVMALLEEEWRALVER